MIRHKYESTSTGTGATITVSVATGYNNDVTTMRPNTLGSSPFNNSVYPYVILDGNGTDWEHGYGRVSGTTFYRDTITESTNTGSRINLSSNTHTVLVPEQPISGSKASIMLTGSDTISSGFGGYITFSVSGNNNGLSQWPGYSTPGTTSLPNLAGVIPYAKSFRVTFYVTSAGSDNSWATLNFSADGNYYGTIVDDEIAIDSSQDRYRTFSTPELEIRCPFNNSSNDGLYSSYYGLYITNNSSASCYFSVTAFIDYSF